MLLLDGMCLFEQGFSFYHGCQAPQLSNLVHFPPVGVGDSFGNDLVEYELGGEGDLFKAPEPIVEEPEVVLDPVTSAFTMMSADLIAEDTLKISNIEEMGDGQLLSDFFYECKNDIIAKSVTGEPLCDLVDMKVKELNHAINNDMSIPSVQMHKSVSSDHLDSIGWNKGRHLRPNFLDFEEMGFGDDTGIRRTHSEGDIQNLGSDLLANIDAASTISHKTLHFRPGDLLASVKLRNEERKEKLLRYRIKKERRNFGRKIKYACRKALADNQLRVRGRFAKTEER